MASKWYTLINNAEKIIDAAPGIRIVRACVGVISRRLERVPSIGSFFYVLRVSSEIRRLESKGNREEARRLRHDAIESTPRAKSALLWLSEGRDLLHYKEDFAGALEAFEIAARTMDQSAALYGHVGPHRVYAGAAQAAIMAGERETAMKHYASFAQWVDYLDKIVGHCNDLEWEHKVMAWLRHELGDPPPFEPL